MTEHDVLPPDIFTMVAMTLGSAVFVYLCFRLTVHNLREFYRMYRFMFGPKGVKKNDGSGGDPKG